MGTDQDAVVSGVTCCGSPGNKTSALTAEGSTGDLSVPKAGLQGFLAVLCNKRPLYKLIKKKQLLTQIPNYILFFSGFPHRIEACIFVKHTELSIKPMHFPICHPAKSIVHSRH